MVLKAPGLGALPSFTPPSLKWYAGCPKMPLWDNLPNASHFISCDSLAQEKDFDDKALPWLKFLSPKALWDPDCCEAKTTL